MGVPGNGWLKYLGEGGGSTCDRRVGLPGRGGLKYPGEESWSTCGEGGWSTWERG